MTIDDLEADLDRVGATTLSAWREHKGIATRKVTGAFNKERSK